MSSLSDNSFNKSRASFGPALDFLAAFVDGLVAFGVLAAFGVFAAFAVFGATSAIK